MDILRNPIRETSNNGQSTRKWESEPKIEKKKNRFREAIHTNVKEIEFIVGNVIRSRKEGNKGTDMERTGKLYTRYNVQEVHNLEEKQKYIT